MTVSPAPRAARPDPWVAAAEAVRLAVLTTPGIADLSDSAAFQTHGRGVAVRGVALRPAGPRAARLEVGVVVEAEVATDPDRLGGVARSVRTAASAAWARTGLQSTSGQALRAEVTVHVVDLDAPPPV